MFNIAAEAFRPFVKTAITSFSVGFLAGALTLGVVWFFCS